MYKPSIKLRVRKLRADKGLTFKEIKEIIPNLSKGTISLWVRDIRLKPSHEKRILEKQLQRRQAFQEYNSQKRLEAEKRKNLIMLKAKEKIKKLSPRDLLIAGSSLYWAEGYKKSRNTIEFANSDPKMILLEMRFFREILKIPENKFRCRLTLHPGLNTSKIKKFWSLLTGIPKNLFYRTQIKPPKSSTGKMLNILYNGTIVIVVNDTNKLNQIKGHIQSLE